MTRGAVDCVGVYGMNQSFCCKRDCFSTESDLVSDDSTVCTDDGEMLAIWVTMLC
jgi:hypothetical protein